MDAVLKIANAYPVFFGMALIGTLLFVLKVLMLFMGGDSDASDIDGDLDFDGETHVDGAESFTLFSVQSILAFIMGCGWVGLAARHEWKVGQGQAIAMAAGFGFAMMLLNAFLMGKMKSLNSNPRDDTSSATGQTGQAYTNIPERGQGSGQVEIAVGGKKQVLQAFSVGEKIDAFTPIIVKQVDSTGNLHVEKHQI
ncbi:MAG: hypothetical protein HOE90_08820 [Bacteriovoracaceae bacterium]|jgi:hypothetical protein|nr:hypothetical protein [Bacteriovoracaceae bacterium]